MQRYFIEKKSVFGPMIEVTGSDFHHIKNVMRFRLGEECEFVDEEGMYYLASLERFEKDVALFQISKRIQFEMTLPKITIAQALIKRDRFELFLEKATEFGVYEIIPTMFERSIIKIDEKEESKKQARYQLIIKEASEQSRRVFSPLLKPFENLTTIDYESFDHVIVCYEAEDTSSTLKKTVKEINPKDKILIVVGPEGGISPKEIQFLQNKKATFVRLGEQILRSESASLFVLSAFHYEWEN